MCSAPWQGRRGGWGQPGPSTRAPNVLFLAWRCQCSGTAYIAGGRPGEAGGSCLAFPEPACEATQNHVSYILWVTRELEVQPDARGGNGVLPPKEKHKVRL